MTLLSSGASKSGSNCVCTLNKLPLARTSLKAALRKVISSAASRFASPPAFLTLSWYTLSTAASKAFFLAAALSACAAFSASLVAAAWSAAAFLFAVAAAACALVNGFSPERPATVFLPFVTLRSLALPPNLPAVAVITAFGPVVSGGASAAFLPLTASGNGMFSGSGVTARLSK